MRLPTLLAAACLAAAAIPAHAGQLADVAVYDRTDGAELPVWTRNGRQYVAGEPGHEYEIHVRSHDGMRLLAVTSVDGVNVLSGKTASTSQQGYVVSPWDMATVAGWRKSLDEVAAFYFTRLPDSYAARTGRPDNVGVIGVALFREKPLFRPCCAPRREEEDSREDRDGMRSGSAVPESEPPSARESEGAPAPSADAPRDEAAPQADDAYRSAQKEKSSRLGTGHGERLDSVVRTVAFERASDTPDEVIAIWYDSRANLVAQGVIPRPRVLADRRPQPFPEGFVPDPR